MRTYAGTQAAVVVRFCATCLDDVLFEQPGCADDHDVDCPEWTCVQCGDAVLVGFSLPERLGAKHATSSVA